MIKGSRKRFLSVLSICLVMLLLLTGCGQSFDEVWNGSSGSESGNGDDDVSNSGSDGGVTLPPIDAELPDETPTPPLNKPNLDFESTPTMEGIDTGFANNYADMFTERDLAGAYDESQSALIELAGDKINTQSEAAQVSGTRVLLSQEGTYIFRGTLDDGTIIVNADSTAKIQIVLDGVDIASSTTAPIYVKKAKKVFITLAEGTENKLSNGGAFTQTDENNVDAVVFSKQDLTLNGAGVLKVESPAGHGIVSKDDLVIAGGSYVINASSRGLDANDSVRIANAFVAISAGKDGIRAKNDTDTARGFVYINDGSYEISAAGDAISASQNVQIDCGKFNLKAGVGAVASDDPSSPSKKGIKANGNLLVVDGSIEIDAFDDAVNTKGSIIFVDGEVTVRTGDDAFHADDSIYAVAVELKVIESREALEALHIDIRGGKLELNSDDDGINVMGGKDDTDGYLLGGNGTLRISGGEISVNALGNGIDVNGEFSMSGGLLRISASAESGRSIFDYVSGGNITGGVFIASGSAIVAQLPKFASQGVLSITTGSREAGEEISVTNADGELVFSEKPTYDYEVFIVSSSDIAVGADYKVSVGSDSGTFKAK